MRFVDEVIIRVEAGKGGHGCLSFRREKYVAKGGPDGGDGGDGASVYLQASTALNTLTKFRYNRSHKAENGQPGMGKDRIGKSGNDLIIEVPLGTLVYQHSTGELIGDLTEPQQKLLVAQGGFHGLGNTRFKSSINRVPRQTTQGTAGEIRELRLELNLLADVGLLGLPNAGKSTLISAVSAARPKVADYPFTTLHPNLGVVDISDDQSFVMADIPGLIPGAADGAGLGIRFLKHLSRTRLILHIIDLSPDAKIPPEQSIPVLVQELVKFNPELAAKPRWLVFNKIDLFPAEQVDKICRTIVKELSWKGPAFKISAANQTGTQALCMEIMAYFS